jgi:hypothetical protein
LFSRRSTVIAVSTNTPCSLRLPQPVRRRIRERADHERRSFANEVRVLLERQLDASEHEPAIGPAEVERLGAVERRDARL